MTITYSEMPVSFASHMFYLGQTNPLTALGKDEAVSDYFKFVIISPIYHVAVSILCAPCGVIYHGIAALRDRVYAFTAQDRGEQERRVTMAWEHLKAARTDLKVTASSLPSIFAAIAGVGFELLFLLIGTGLSLEILSLIDCTWLFSSTVVAIPNAPEHLNQGQISSDLKNGIPKLWGMVQLYPGGYASYRTLRSCIYNNWISTNNHLPETDPRILKNALIKVWSNSINSASFWAKIWPARPQECHLASSFSRPADKNLPAYTRPWEAVSLLVQAIAYATLGVCVGAIMLLLLYVLCQRETNRIDDGGKLLGFIFSILMWLFSRAATCYQEAAKSYTNQHGSTEYNFANEILKKFNDDPHLSAERNFIRCKTQVAKALYWYKEAAIRGYVPAQYALGFGIFAAFSYYENVQSMEDDDLELLGEAVRWLQAAAINGNEDAERFLKRCFQLTSIDRVYQGVAGESEPERVRQMFRFADMDVGRDGGILKAAKAVFSLKYPQVGEKIQLGLLEPKKESIARKVQEVTGLIPPLANIVARYCHA